MPSRGGCLKEVSKESEENKMEEKTENKKTLKEYLDSIGVHSGDDRGFVLVDGLFSSTRMEVSRRYLESEPWKYLLDKTIYSIDNTTNMYGYSTLLVILEN